MVKTEKKIPQKTKRYPSKLVNSIIFLAEAEKDKLEASEYINHTYQNTPGDTTSATYVIKIPRFDPSTPEEWIIFMDLVQKIL